MAHPVVHLKGPWARSTAVALASIAWVIFSVLPAHALWSSYEYKDLSSNKTRYGITNGTDKVELNQKNRKKAAKAAGKMNAIEKGVMAGPDGEGDFIPGGPLPK